MLKNLLPTLRALIILLEAVLWLRVLFVFVKASNSNGLVAWIIKLSSILLWPFGGILNLRVSILGLPVDITALVAIFILNIISYALLEIKKGYE